MNRTSQNEISAKNENKSLIIWKRLCIISISTAVLLLAWDNKNMLIHFNAQNLSKPTLEQLLTKLTKDNYAGVNLTYYNKDGLPSLPNSCGVRSVFSALSMMWATVDPVPFIKFHNENVGSFGMPPGLMQEFLDTLKPLGVEYSVYDTHKMSDNLYRDFLINAIIDGKAPIVLIKQRNGLFHWVTIRTIFTEDMAEMGSQTKVEIVEDMVSEYGLLIRGNKSVLSLDEFNVRRKLPLGIQQATFLLGVVGRDNNTKNMNLYPLNYDPNKLDL